MSTQIKNVAVIGAGTMGAGIAGLCAAKGCNVTLLDMTADIADKGLARLTTGKRPAIATDDAAKITTGAIEDLQLIADCDWICEAVVEDLAIKRDLFSRLENNRKDGSILSTNTSGIPLCDIYADMPERLQKDIAVTHFFNPVHIMKLVELVPGRNTDPAVMTRLADFFDNTLDKGAVHAKDTVNFIGNRIGCFWMLAGLQKSAESGLSIETVDALMSAPIGLPPTGLYGLIDLVGLDVMNFVAKNLQDNLPQQDACRSYLEFPKPEAHMLANGQLGRKSGGGFYKMTVNAAGDKSMEVFDLQQEDWRAMQQVELTEPHTDIAKLMFGTDAESVFVWELMSATLDYTSALVPQISDDIVNIDRAMKWGFNWAQGPFELLDSIGPRRFAEKLTAAGGAADGILKVLVESGHETFYRQAGSQYLGLDGNYHQVPG